MREMHAGIPHALYVIVIRCCLVVPLIGAAIACGSSEPLPVWEESNVATSISTTTGSGAGTACWFKGSHVQIRANMSLGSTIDGASEDAARLAALQQAAAAWNTELAAVGANITIDVVGSSSPPSAASAGKLSLACKTPEGHQVSTRTKSPPPDGVSTAGFSHDADGPGYSASSNLSEPLIETILTRTSGSGFVSEVDVVFHTHDSSCKALPWSFRGPRPDHYDFQSAALHAMGHALGVDHVGGGVMQPTLALGASAQISASDRASLRTLYENCRAGALGGGTASSSGSNSSSSSSGIPETPRPGDAGVVK